MNTNRLLQEVLAHIRLVKDDKQKLQQILEFLENEIVEEQEEELLEIPGKYEKLLEPIAESIDCGMICYLNTDTLEMEEVPGDMINNPQGYEMATGSGIEGLNLKHEECCVIEPLESHESFKIMEAFAEKVTDAKFRKQLFYMLNNRNPFANFKWKVENSPYRQNWFDFKQEWLERHVREELYWFLAKQKTD